MVQKKKYSVFSRKEGGGFGNYGNIDGGRQESLVYLCNVSEKGASCIVFNSGIRGLKRAFLTNKYPFPYSSLPYCPSVIQY